jgi:hypothetical protein
MNPEDMSVALRERQGLEGADMGVRMLQANLGAVYRPWLALMIPLFGLCLASGLVHPTLASIMIWWLAPVGERLVVMVLSRAAFSKSLSCKEALRETWTRGLNGVFLQLTILRFSPNRGMMTPVLALEQPTFAAYRKRATALLRQNNGAFGLTFAFLHAEWFAQFSAVGLAAMLMPQHAVQWQYWAEAALGDTGTHVMNVAYALVVLAIRPFYAAAGFGLYLSRRTNLEGWDIELVFRGMAKRLAGALGVILIACMALPGVQVRAESSEPKELIQEIVEEPPFRNEIEQREFFDFSWFGELLEGLFGSSTGGSAVGILGVLGRVVAVVALGILIFMAVRACMKVIVPKVSAAEPQDDHEVGVSFLGGGGAAEPLPVNPAAAARKLAEAGKLRQALSLLIRAAIVRLRERFGLKIPKGSTERECLRHVRATAPDLSHRHFQRLLAAWQVVAYAGRDVPVEDVLNLVDDFDQAYGRQAPPEVSS